MSYKDSDFAIHKNQVLWTRPDHVAGVWLPQDRWSDIDARQRFSYAGPSGEPTSYVVDYDCTLDCEIIRIYDSKGNLLHKMEDKDGIHRGTDQKVHGSATGPSSGSQPTGTSIAAPGTYTINNAGNTVFGSSYPYYGAIGGTSQGSVTSHSAQQAAYQQMLLKRARLQAQQMMQYQNPTYTPYFWSNTVAGGYSITGTPEPKKKIKDEGIRVGEIIAYRCWPIHNSGFLWSTAADRAWAPGEPMKAGENHLRDGLGVYAFKNMSHCIQEFGNERFYSNGVAYGSVVLWGEIVEHQLGYRAEYAAIRSIEFVRNVPHNKWHPEMTDELRKLYKVEGK